LVVTSDEFVPEGFEEPDSEVVEEELLQAERLTVSKTVQVIANILRSILFIN